MKKIFIILLVSALAFSPILGCTQKQINLVEDNMQLVRSGIEVVTYAFVRVHPELKDTLSTIFTDIKIGIMTSGVSTEHQAVDFMKSIVAKYISNDRQLLLFNTLVDFLAVEIQPLVVHMTDKVPQNIENLIVMVCDNVLAVTMR